MKYYIFLVKKFIHIWDIVFTFIDSRQLLIWCKMNDYLTKLENQQIIGESYKDWEDYNDWDEV